MTHETCFDELAAYGILIRAGAVIPSLSALRQRLASRITAFSQSLTEEHHDAEQSHSLCCLLRYFLDLQLQQHQQHCSVRKTRSGGEPQAPAGTDSRADISVVLQALLVCGDNTLFRYGYRLLCLLSVTENSDRAVTDAFLAEYRKRYFSLPGMTPHPVARTPGDSPEAGKPQICLITGPCAVQGFSQYDTTGSRDLSCHRVVVTDPQVLMERIRYFSEKHPQVAIQCLIPLTGDTFASDALLAAAFVHWRHSLLSAVKLPRVRCQLVVYARLSHRHPPGAPRDAAWVRTPPGTGSDSFSQWLTRLHQQLQNAARCGDSYATARACAAKPLSEWLTGGELNSALGGLFTDTPLQLTELLLADIRQGFPRHGGWSHWLAERYLLYPALSQAAPCLPLPPLLPVASEPPGEPCTASVSPRKRQRFVVPGLLLCLSLSATLLLSGSRPPLTGPPLMPSAVIAPLSLPDDGTGWFDPGSSTITGTRYQTLAALLPALRRTSQYPVLIVGYTDNTGTAAGNRYLSLRRAESVRDWLVANSEFPSSHFIVDGAGETRPITTNDSQQGRAGNRRIEIIPLYPHLFQVNKDYD